MDRRTRSPRVGSAVRALRARILIVETHRCRRYVPAALGTPRSPMPLEQHALVDDPDRLVVEFDSLTALEVVGVNVERADWNRCVPAAALI